MKLTKFFALLCAVVAFAACEKPYEYPTYEEEELPAIELIAPAVDAVVDAGVDAAGAAYEYGAKSNPNAIPPPP